MLSPEALMEKAVEAGLSTIAVTDHDTVDGLADARLAADERNLKFVPGIEISAVESSREIHILGYFVDPENSTLRTYSSRVVETRRGRIRSIVDRLGEMGMELDYDAIVQRSGPGTIGRPHVAQALVESRHVDSTHQA
ncbi:MAG: PHP domain-containing protein, partial [Rhodothermales bacterium]|nr:PHP domain-containing protein [Rhodothermales bacterium]